MWCRAGAGGVEVVQVQRCCRGAAVVQVQRFFRSSAVVQVLRSSTEIRGDADQVSSVAEVQLRWCRCAGSEVQR